MRARSVFAVAVLVVSVLALAACDGLFSPSQTVNVTVSQITPSPSPSASSSPPLAAPPAGCAAVDRVDVVAHEESASGPVVTSFKVAAAIVVDATPRAGGVAVPSSCHGPSVTWSNSRPTACVFLGDITGFVPGLTCSSAGPLSVYATVATLPSGGGGGSGRVDLVVVP